ncbi:MAG TPA: hypothetical protein PLR08_00440 [bacterium]|nr:MAG: hypothetical protein H6759_05430 [Candidatus Nomurabacteria bacterium]HPF95005.1 hypothetical protein [bacterium]
MKYFYSKAVLLTTSVGTALTGTVVHAAGNPFGSSGSAQQELGKVQTASGLGTGDLSTMIGTIINVVLGFMGIVLLFYIILAGWEWMSAGGEKDGVETAKARIKNAVIGLVIIVSAYAISTFVIDQLVKLT